MNDPDFLKLIEEKTKAYRYMRSKFPELHREENGKPWRHLSERDKEICGVFLRIILAFENEYDVTINSFSKPAGFWDVVKKNKKGKK